MKTRLIDRLRCSREGGCQCTEPEEAWVCRHSRMISREVLAGELRPLAARRAYRAIRPAGSAG